jgi:DNA-binding response OmpR family regulator
MLPDHNNNPDPGNVLIVDDEQNIRRGLSAVLAKDGHKVQEAESAESAIPLLESFNFDVAIVDIRMPGLSGVELLTEIRARWPNMSVILLTGHGTLETAMKAIKEGAHDYLLKPAQPDAIRQAVNTALIEARRRSEQGHLLDSLRTSLERLGQLPPSQQPQESKKPRSQIIVGDLEIDPRAHQVWRNKIPLSLTPSEYQLLLTLSERAGEVVDYITLVQLSLDYQAEPWEAKELIKRHVFSLRQKIEPEPSAPRYILNVRGIGYRMATTRELE